MPDRPPAMALDRPAGALAVEAASFVPPGAQDAVLHNLSFWIEPGEALAVVGPSAAGKTTLARLLVGAVAPTAGHVRLDGAELAVWQANGGARHFGYLPQDIELFAGTVRDNIARLGVAEPAAVVEAATLTGVHDAIMRLPQGYDTEIGVAGVKLSGGQRQRIGLARAVFGSPCLVVLDEPNSNLDAEGRSALLATVARLKERRVTTVLITHDPAMLDQADKLLVLNQGAAVVFGPRAEALARLAGTQVRRLA
jgi:ABC-type protease/lipase transport system fused ATPase/permease subunit